MNKFLKIYFEEMGYIQFRINILACIPNSTTLTEMFHFKFPNLCPVIKTQ